MTRGLTPEQDAELANLRERFAELMAPQRPEAAANGRDELARVQARIKDLLEISNGRLQLRIDWHPSKPNGWEGYEDKIRTFLSVDAARTHCDEPPVVVRIEQGPSGRWRCTNVWSNNMPCPASERTVDRALGPLGSGTP